MGVMENREEEVAPSTTKVYQQQRLQAAEMKEDQTSGKDDTEKLAIGRIEKEKESGRSVEKKRVEQLEKQIADLKKGIKLLEDKVQVQTRSLQSYGIMAKTVQSSVKGVKKSKYELSKLDVNRGGIVASSFLGMVISWSVLPRLWLLGLSSGIFVGYSFVERNDKLGLFLRRLGVQVAFTYYNLREQFDTMLFLYQQGKLAKVYVKKWEVFDKSVGLTDALNRARYTTAKQYADIDKVYGITEKFGNLAENTKIYARSVAQSDSARTFGSFLMKPFQRPASRKKRKGRSARSISPARRKDGWIGKLVGEM